jgi:hypothetical protein
MKIKLIILFMWCCVQPRIYGQQEKIILGELLLNPQYKNTITIFKDSDLSKPLIKIKNNLKDEDFINFEILEKTTTAFKVRANYCINGLIGEGWVSKDNHLGVYLRGYNYRIPVYKQPNTLSGKLFDIEYDSHFKKVLDCVEGWMLLDFGRRSQRKQGWVQAKDLCTNPYTTCN